MATRQRQRRRPTGGYYTGTDRQTDFPTHRRGRRRPPSGHREATESRDRAHQRSIQNTQQQEIVLDLAQLTLDITGILDPTPLSDGTNMLISLTRGKWTDALISGVSLLPYLGDLAKLAKLSDYSDTVQLAKEIAKTDPAWRRVLRDMFTPLKALLDNVAKAGAETLPLKVRQWLRHVRYEIDEFLEQHPKIGSTSAQKSTAAASPPSKPMPTTYGTGKTRTIRRVGAGGGASGGGKGSGGNGGDGSGSDVPPNKPHGLHNQEWDNVDAKDFKTRRPVDMENLPEADEAAKETLLDQGRSERDVKQLLSSGENFGTKQLQPGDKLYGFDSQANKYGAKNQKSMYWLDEAGYQDVKSKFYKDGVWDKEGVKNHLALPCYNRADVIDTATVTQSQTAIQSTIGKATEQIGYTRGDYSTGMLGKIMPGGGTQITPDANAISTVSRLSGTP